MTRSKKEQGSPALTIVWLLLVAYLSRSVEAQSVANYAQCGGIDLCGGEDTDCLQCESEEFECVRQNPYYYQCIASDSQQDELEQDQVTSVENTSGNESAEEVEEESNDVVSPSMVSTPPSSPEPNDMTTNGDLSEIDPVSAALAGLEEMAFASNDAADEPSGARTNSAQEDTYPAVDDYGECGGLNMCDGEDIQCGECSEDFDCKRQNPWYYQCVPKAEAPLSQEESMAEVALVENGLQIEALGMLAPNSNAQNETLNPDDSEVNHNNALNASLSETNTNTTMNETSPASLSYPAVDDYGECGGKTMCEGEDKQCGQCSESFACVRSNEWYYQCVPSTTSKAVVEELSVNEELQNATVENTTTPLNATFDGLAKTTTFFDGCKPTCAWPGNIGKDTANGPVTTCTNKFDENGNQGINSDPNVKSVCGGGGNEPTGNDTVAYSCVDRSPWTENGQRYAFVAANSQCCACYELTYLATSLDGNGDVCEDCSQYGGELEGETIIVQVINSGGDLGINQFDVMIPGGGLGIYNGVVGEEAANGPALFPDSNEEDWGERYGGVKTKEECAFLPAEVRAGCEWQFDSLQNADNPGVSYKRISCGAHPSLSRKSGCLLAEDVA